ncbi:P-loop NTPase fold protein [Streptomyces sp. NPDC002520]
MRAPRSDRVRNQTETGVLALIDPWGSGKSSVLGKVTHHLRETDDDEGWLVAELNPWLYSDLESLPLAQFSEIREALPKRRAWKAICPRSLGSRVGRLPVTWSGPVSGRYRRCPTSFLIRLSVVCGTVLLFQLPPGGSRGEENVHGGAVTLAG